MAEAPTVYGEAKLTICHGPIQSGAACKTKNGLFQENTRSPFALRALVSTIGEFTANLQEATAAPAKLATRTR